MTGQLKIYENRQEPVGGNCLAEATGSQLSKRAHRHTHCSTKATFLAPFPIPISAKEPVPRRRQAHRSTNLSKNPSLSVTQNTTLGSSCQRPRKRRHFVTASRFIIFCFFCPAPPPHFQRNLSCKIARHTYRLAGAAMQPCERANYTEGERLICVYT